ncbi:MAG TPA: glycosyltransferase family A protein [Solirubrobacteraceae bacterium]|jgi:rhamnosyltransferase|nr:glycosyltransferase family A protein [Solirubrobacteraceae bacterium]
MSSSVTVAIPTLDAGPGFARTLAAVRAQRIDADMELLVCDSGSADDTVALARAHGAHVIQIARAEFSHGGTRNLLMSRAAGDHVAFLTQDAVPDGEGWLAALVAAFTLAPDVGLAFGPYRPRPEASIMVRRELTGWFQSFSIDGRPRIDALDPARRDVAPSAFMGHLGFFTDANGCVARAAWERVPFRQVAYAEDHLLAQDMLRAGYAKVYAPDAAVIHSHDYSAGQWLRRSFDEARAVREVYGWALAPRAAVRNVRGGIAGDWRWARAASNAPGARGTSLLVASALHHAARAAGGLLGGHAHRLPPALVARLSLEGRA